MAGTRRRFSAAFKAKVALEAFRGHRSTAELAGEHQAHPSQITQWKKHLLAGATELFNDHQTQDRQQHEELVARLYQQIGQLKVEVDFLQKKLWTN